jgi:hypothetical protein
MFTTIHTSSLQKASSYLTKMLVFSCFMLLSLLFLSVINGLSTTQPDIIASSCQSVRYVVVDTFNVEVYDQSIHGSAYSLRLFDRMPSSACYNNMVMKTVALSSRTDVQVRDPKTGLILYDRGFFQWAASLLKYTPFAFVGAALSLGSCVITFVQVDGKGGGDSSGPAICIAAASFALLGSAYPAWQTIANGLGSSTANAAEVFAMTASAFENDESFLDLSRRQDVNSTLGSLNMTMFHQGSKYLYHAADGHPVSLAHIFRANATHPLHVYQHGLYETQNRTVRMWPDINNSTSRLRVNMLAKIPYASNSDTNGTLKKRQCETQQVGQGTYEVCDGPPANGGPEDMYYGWDLYGTKKAIDEFEDDEGTTYDNSNGFVNGMLAMGNDIYDRQAWDTCVCQESNNQWIATGSLQLSWDNTYNGYSPCWNANCDGNTQSN